MMNTCGEHQAAAYVVLGGAAVLDYFFVCGRSVFVVSKRYRLRVWWANEYACDTSTMSMESRTEGDGGAGAFVQMEGDAGGAIVWLLIVVDGEG